MDMKCLIKGGYEEELRNDFKVTEKRKRIWEKELYIYKVFAEICEKHDLRYFVAFGSLLGAIRHHGFIPWDDDFDVMMPREDYEFFCKIAADELNPPYFFQTPYTDEDYFYSYVKLRDSSTASFRPMYKTLRMNLGMCIDIFPLDYCDFDTAAENQAKIYKHIMACSSHMKRHGVDLLNERQLENYNKYHTDNPISDYEAIQSIAKNPNAKGKGLLGVSAITVYPYAKMIWPAECFDNYELANFENIMVRVPKGYEKVLTTTYGNYMEFPPIEKRGTWHEGLIQDPYHSYKEYQNDSIQY